MKRLLIIAGLLAAIGAGYGLYQFNRTSNSTIRQKPEYILKASELSTAFANDEAMANEKYLGKVIQVEGTLLGKETGEFWVLTLEGIGLVNIRAELLTGRQPELKTGETVKVKGVCSGSLLDVVLSDCITIE